MTTNNGRKTHMNDLLPKPHIRASDLKGREITLTIKGWDTKEFYSRTDQENTEKGVVYFQGTPKYLIVNKTQVEQIAKAVGSEYLEDWIGKKIVLYVTQVNSFGKMEDAIRIKKAAAPVQAGTNGQSQQDQAHDKDPLPEEETENEDLEETPLTAQEYRNIAFGKLGADPELVNAIDRECGGDYDKALEALKKQLPPVGGE